MRSAARMDEQSSFGEPSEQGSGRARVIEMDVGDEICVMSPRRKPASCDGALEHRRVEPGPVSTSVWPYGP
jgi:hypothetical protein